jgi:hypothetical protein
MTTAEVMSCDVFFHVLLSEVSWWARRDAVPLTRTPALG